MDTIALPVAEVVVLEDRAQVLRRGRVTLAAGANRVRVAGLSPILADKTLVGGSISAGVRIADVRVRRERIARAERPAELAAVEAALERNQRAQAALEHEARSLDSIDGQLGALRHQLLNEAVVDTAWGRAAPAFWLERLREIELREDSGTAARTGLAQRQRTLEREAEDLERRQELLATPTAEVACSAELLIEAGSACEAELTLAYVVPNACWRPCYVARLLDRQVRLDAEACVWQRTGEDWNGVRLRLSTERLDLGSEPPRLGPDLLQLRPKAAQIVVAERERILEDTGGASGAPAAELPGVDDGGEARLLAAPGAHDLAGDGLPHRVPLFAFTVPATVRLVVRAELAAAAILASRQANTAPQPLLAGPVELIRDGGAAGRTTLAFTAPGAEFELGWGADPDLRVARQAWEKNEEPGMLGSWRLSDRMVRLFLTSLATAPRTVEVEERIPVSELAQVKVEFEAEKTRPAAKPDADGIVRWSVTVPPRGQTMLDLNYRVRTQAAVKG